MKTLACRVCTQGVKCTLHILCICDSFPSDPTISHFCISHTLIFHSSPLKVSKTMHFCILHRKIPENWYDMKVVLWVLDFRAPYATVTVMCMHVYNNFVPFKTGSRNIWNILSNEQGNKGTEICMIFSDLWHKITIFMYSNFKFLGSLLDRNACKNAIRG